MSRVRYGAFMTFPPTRRVAQIDDFFGTEVSDPFRWLEGPSTDPEISTWVHSQAAFARDYLDGLPGRSVIRSRVAALASLPTETAPRRQGGQWFRFTNDGTAEQLEYRVADTPTGTGTVLIDPNPLTENSTTSISAAVPSPDGKYVAYTYSEAGSDWQTWRVREVASGQDHPETVAWAKFTEAAWLPDSTGFFYGGFARPDTPASDAPASDALIDANRRHQLRLHRLGTSDTDDVLVFDLPDEPQVLFSPEISDDDRWLIILAERGTDPTNRVWIADLTKTGRQQHPTPLIATVDAAWRPVAAADGSLVLFTDADAPRGRLVRLDLESGDITELVAQRASILSDACSAGGRLVLHWLSDAHSELTVHDLDGRQVGEITLPGLGSVLEVQARHDSPLLHLTYTSFGVARLILQHDLDSGRSTAVFATPDEGLADVVTEQVRFTSADGTSIPMFLVHLDKLEISSGPHPTLLYGYGGFRVPVLPAFNVSRAAFVAAGGVLAIPSLRGGGEYGAEWHDAGRLANKQNVFDDAIAAAEYLIEQGWTTSSQLACNGGSNGGLLVGALLTQRPDLFAAAVPEVGVLDLLRFQHFTIGWAWTSDYGDPDRSEAEFASAYAYSPYHRLSDDVRYPATLVMTSDHDDRVIPAHSYKFAARLQEVSPDGAVALLRVELDGGHGAGRARSAIIDERTDALSFISNAVGLSR
ncbi:MAG: prolyl oligopeptidase [Pseudonocardiales bacterium]|nr:prolyl oligopeptidase [Pseudonocardiales bacterium]